MVVIPLVPETKMADVGKLISLGNLLVRKVTWLVLITTSATLILSREFGANCMTRIAYIYSRLSRTHSFPFRLTETTRFLTLRLTETTHSFHFDFQRQHTLSYICLPAVNPTKMYTLCSYFLPCSTFTVRLVPASNTTTEISSNYRKKQTTNMGEDTFLLTCIIKIQ